MARLPFNGGGWRITQRFGANPKAYSKFGMLGHNGIDFDIIDREVVAPVSGRVTEAGYDVGGYGYYIVTAEYGTQDEWLVAHMQPSLKVRVGAEVLEGQRLGISDNTGNSSGPHMHLAYRPFGYDRTNGYLGYQNPRPHLTGMPPYRVCLQAGHYPNGGGAPGEAEWTMKLARLLAKRLSARGIETVIVGDFFNKPVPPEVTQDYDVFYSIHYDASVYGPTSNLNTGCFVDAGEKETEVWEAARFNNLWEAIYPRSTGILHVERANPNTDYYYAWAALSGSTPGLVAEHGCGSTTGFWSNDRYYPIGGDRDVLHDQTDRVAEAVEAVFVRYFSLGVGPAPEPGPAPDEYRIERWGMFGMDRDNCIEFVLAPLYAMAGQTLIRDGGLTKALADTYLNGVYFGRPLSAELPMPQRGDGVNGVQQFFEHGQYVYWFDGKTEWIGGMPVQKEAVA